MENSLAKIETLSDAQLTGYLDAMGLAAKLTEKEKIQFLEISKAFGLNPFKREIYCSKYGEGASAQMSIIVGYETYIKRAERSGQLDGWNVITEGKVEDKTLKAIITIHRKDRKMPFVHEVYYSEYVQLNGQGQITKFWQKAFTMTKKVAIAQGFRLCFSDELGGIPYTKEEINETEDAEYTDVTAQTPLEKSTPEQEAYNMLSASKSLDELAKNWKAIGKDRQELPQISELKERLKKQLQK